MRIRSINADMMEFSILFSNVDSWLDELKQDKDLMTKPNLYNFYQWLSAYKTIVEEGGNMINLKRVNLKTKT